MRMIVHRWMFNTRRDRYDAGLEYAGMNKRRVNRRRMENGILKYVSARALCRRTWVRDGRPYDRENEKRRARCNNNTVQL